MEDNVDDDGEKESSEYKEELAKKQEEEILAQSKDVSLLLQHSKLKKIAEARQVRYFHLTVQIFFFWKVELYFVDHNFQQ